MRILNVRFKNLASLWGDWKIDFTNPAYAQGVFAITGPDGAGKAVIFNAICLALYGQTQLNLDNLSTEEFCRADECFAEVTFETGAGKYRAFWEQFRADKKADTRHEIFDAAAGKTLEVGQGGASEKVAEIIGLSFGRFVRSALLAQGDFAAFLNSGAEERSAIFERITGPEIYSQLAVRAHEIRNMEQVALNLAEAEAAGFRDMEAGEKEAIETQIESLLREEAATVEKLEQSGAEHDWLQGMLSAQKELDALDDKQKDLVRRQEGFESERARLLRAQRALEFGSAHAALVTFRRDQEVEKHSLLECHAKLPVLENELRRSEEALQLAISSLSDKQTDQKNHLDLLRRVRELDLKQKEKDAPIREAQSASEEFAMAAEVKREWLEAEQVKFEAAQVQMRDVRKFLQDNVVDERLIEQFAGIKSRFDSYCSSLDKRRRKGEERSAAEKLKKETQKRMDGQIALHDTAKARFASAENSIKKQSDALIKMLGAHSMPEWREIFSRLLEREVKLIEIENAFKQRAEIAALLQELKSRKDVLEFSREECLRKITARRERLNVLGTELQHLDIQAELIKGIKELEEARARLMDDLPCPLCGSVSHPYVLGNIPKEDDIRLPVQRVKQDIESENNAISELCAENERRAEEYLREEADEERIQFQLQDLERQLTEELAVLQLTLPKGVDPLVSIGVERHRSEEHLHKTRLLLERAEKDEENLNLTKDELEFARQERDELANSRQESEFENETAARDLERLTQESRLYDEELKNMRHDLSRQIISFGYRSIPEERPEQIQEALEARLTKWQEQHGLKQELEKQLFVWERDLQQERSALGSLNLKSKDRSEAAKKLRSEKDALLQQRTSIFGEKDPGSEEAKQNEFVEKAEKQVEEKRVAKGIASHALADLRSKMEDLVKSMHIRAGNLQKAEIYFKKQLIANDFSNEDAYLSACLQETERKTLQERASSLDMEQTELETMRVDKKFGLEELRRMHVTDLALEDASEKKAQLAAQMKELRQSIDSLRIRLKEGEGLSLKKAELVERAEKQRMELRRWESLHNLVSADSGQKHEKHGNFAQELAFEMLLRGANRLLFRMTERYSLIKDEVRPLSLNVMSSGGRLPPESLSAGESFIASLALALSLSQMAGQNVKVDSLFLNETGSLDEEGLDMAFSAFGVLKREGRLLGIASNSEALKKRVTAQIEIIPQDDGRSVIKTVRTDLAGL